MRSSLEKNLGQWFRHGRACNGLTEDDQVDSSAIPFQLFYVVLGPGDKSAKRTSWSVEEIMCLLAAIIAAWHQLGKS